MKIYVLKVFALHGSEASMDKASKGEGVIVYSEPLVTQSMGASDPPNR